MRRSSARRRATPWLRSSLLAAITIGFFATTALAKDVCITMDSNNLGPLTYVFHSPKVPKAGKLASVDAVVFPGGGTLGNTPAVAHGTIYGKSDGKLRVGLSIQGLLATGIIYDHVLDDALVDRSFTGSNLIVTPNDATSPGSWRRADCKTITLP